MGLLINTSDFIGKHTVGKTNYDSLDAYIDRYEEIFLVDLLGASLFALFKTAWLNSQLPIPIALPVIYQKIYDAIRLDDTTFCYEYNNDYGNVINQNFGMKSMVLGFVWFQYLADVKVKMTTVGGTIDEVEISAKADVSYMTQRYNESINDQNVIQWYIKENLFDYPTYNGRKKGLIHWSL